MMPARARGASAALADRAPEPERARRPPRERLGVGRLPGQYAWYTAGVFLQKAAALALVPLYTSRLTTADYGILEIVQSVLGLATVFVALGVPSAINKCWHRDCRTDEERGRLLGTAVVLTVALLGLVAAGAMVWARPLSRLVFDGAEHALYVRLGVGCLVLAQTTMISLELARTVGRARQYLAFSLLQMAVQIGASVVLLVVFHLGVTGILGANLVAAACLQLASLPFLRRSMRLGFAWSHAAALVGFGMAMIPVSVASWVTNVSDRFFLQRYASASEVGVYGLGYKFGILLELALILPFQKAWNPIVFSIGHRPGAPVVLGRTLTYYLGLLVLGLAALTIGGDPLVRLLANPNYHAAAAVIPVVALAYLFSGVSTYLGTGLIIAGHTRAVAAVAGAGALANVGLNLALIPPYGMMGAAVSTVLSFALAAGLSLAASRRWYPIPVEYARLAKVVGAALVVALLAGRIHGASPVWELAAREATLVLVAPLLLVLGFPTPRERAWLARLPHRVADAVGR